MSLPETDPAGDPVSSRKVLELLTVANDYCLFMEKTGEYSRDEILQYLQKVLPLIYIKEALLPLIDETEDGTAEHFVTEEQWEDLFNSLRAKLGEEDIYYFIDLDEPGSQDPVRASISENLADIYQDLKDFLLLYQKPFHGAKLSAVRDCRYLFATRTGTALINAHKAIHSLVNKSTIQPDPLDSPG